jgi:hypothetical protein
VGTRPVGQAHVRRKVRRGAPAHVRIRRSSSRLADVVRNDGGTYGLVGKIGSRMLSTPVANTYPVPTPRTIDSIL